MNTTIGSTYGRLVNILLEDSLLHHTNGKLSEFITLRKKCETSMIDAFSFSIFMELMLFNAMVMQVLLNGVEVWGCTIPLNAWNEIEKIQNMFLRRQLGVKSTTSYQVMVSERNVRPHYKRQEYAKA